MIAVQSMIAYTNEPSFLGYDGPGSAAPYFQSAPFRSSDHDPVVVSTCQRKKMRKGMQ